MIFELSMISPPRLLDNVHMHRHELPPENDAPPFLFLTCDAMAVPPTIF